MTLKGHYALWPNDSSSCLRTLNQKQQLRHRAVSLPQRGFLVCTAGCLICLRTQLDTIAYHRTASHLAAYKRKNVKRFKLLCRCPIGHITRLACPSVRLSLPQDTSKWSANFHLTSKTSRRNCRISTTATAN